MPVSPDRDSAGRQKALARLGLLTGAGKGEVRQAYRRLALLCHPDLHPGEPGMERRFRELSEAYCLLLTVGTGEPPALPIPPPGLPARGGDLQYSLRLDFLQAARGGEFPVRFTRRRPCPACGGIAARPAAAGGRPPSAPS
ncbi:MAG: DnaJ domain-containing protein [Candidatus Tectomicrobia bacterium]|nr:DnaJ domain-containing protein [Candidatus Tectomicrobia bacterium]